GFPSCFGSLHGQCLASCLIKLGGVKGVVGLGKWFDSFLNEGSFYLVARVLLIISVLVVWRGSLEVLEWSNPRFWDVVGRLF
ncbi:hypothetical protein ES288_A01G183300v1, partial [Gossypium darwinii]